MRKISGTIQRRNDEQVGLLGPDLHTASLPVGEDHYPDGDRRGLATRFVDPLGAGVYTDHFRSGVIPTGFAWQGAPFAAPALTDYSYRNEYLGVANAGAARCFMSKAVTNAAASWQNLNFYARVGARGTGRIGIRLDAGNDLNYAEIYVDATAGTGSQLLNFRYRTGGAITTVASSFLAPAGTLTTLRLLCYFSGGNYYLVGYVISESRTPENVAGFITPVLGWMPTAGRAGILYESAGGSAYSDCDWFSNEFT